MNITEKDIGKKFRISKTVEGKKTTVDGVVKEWGNGGPVCLHIETYSKKNDGEEDVVFVYKNPIPIRIPNNYILEEIGGELELFE